MGRTARFVWTAALVGLTAGPAYANRASEALRARGTAQIYNLDREQALVTYRQAVAADPQDAAAHRGLASVLWLSITFRRGNMTVDEYMGRVSRAPAAPVPPPPETAAAFREALDQAVRLARRRLDASPNDADAHYQVGSAVGLRASYAATVEGGRMAALRAAREAYEAHDNVLRLDPRRKDAGLIVGTYRYLVSALALPMRWMAYMAGFGGGRERGIKFVEEAAAYAGDNQTDARLALILMYNRERRYDDALTQLAAVREQYPRNRLAWLEAGSTYLRAGRAADAERMLSDGIAKFAGDDRPRMFGELALWFYKRGAARALLGRAADAEQDLRRAVSLEGRKWVHGRAHLELGKLALKSGRAAEGRQELGAAVAMGDADNDGATADEARKLLR